MSDKELEEKINQRSKESEKMASDFLDKIIKLVEEEESKIDKALVVKSYFDFSLILLCGIINSNPNKEIKKNILERAIKVLKILEDAYEDEDE